MKHAGASMVGVPRGRSSICEKRDGQLSHSHALKMHFLASCDKQHKEDALATVHAQCKFWVYLGTHRDLYHLLRRP